MALARSHSELPGLNSEFDALSAIRTSETFPLDQENMNLQDMFLARTNSVDMNVSKMGEFQDLDITRPTPLRASARSKYSGAVPSVYVAHEEDQEDTSDAEGSVGESVDEQRYVTTHPPTTPARVVPPSPNAYPAENLSVPATPAEHSVKRSLRAAPRRKVELVDDEDEDSDDEIDLDGTGIDRSQHLEKLRRVLQDKINDLNNINKNNKGMSPSDRKKIRNRKASCVSRLKKKVALCEMQGHLEAQKALIDELKACVEEREALLAKHNIPYRPFVMRDLAPFRATSPPTPVAAAPAPAPQMPAPVTPPVAPRRPRGRPSKKAKLAEAAAIVAQETAGLKRADSVVDSVCLCHDRPSGTMVDCTRCHKSFHAVCVGNPNPSTFICYICC